MYPYLAPRGNLSDVSLPAFLHVVHGRVGPHPNAHGLGNLHHERLFGHILNGALVTFHKETQT